MEIELSSFFNLMHYEYGEAYFGSHKGMRYRLAREPKDCNIGDILRTVEGSLTPIECVSGSEGNPCPLSDSCSTLPFWAGLDKVVNDYINSYSLQDLIDQN